LPTKAPKQPGKSSRTSKPAAAAKKTAKKAAGPTPAMQQYLDQKVEVGDALLLFRMGDFYEVFYDDAAVVAKALGLTLTARNKSGDDPIPMAGVPYHAAEGYIARLVKAGFKVAISEQIEDPKTAKGVVKRAVQRIITPGTLTDDALLHATRANVLVALCPRTASWSASQFGIATLELASGRFAAEVIDRTALEDHLARVGAAEVLIPELDDAQACPLDGHLAAHLRTVVSPRAAHTFEKRHAEKTLTDHFGVSSLAGFGFDSFDASLRAAGAVLDYLGETQRSSLAHIAKLLPAQSSHCLMLDQVTLRSLEVETALRDGSREGTLLAAVDETANPMGARRLREWLCFPLLKVDAIRARQRAITDLRDQPERLKRIRALLREFGDVERILGRLGVGRVSPRDLRALGDTLQALDTLRDAIAAPVQQDDADLLEAIRQSLDGMANIGATICATLVEEAPPIQRDGGYIASGIDAELDRLRRIESDGAAWLAEYQAAEAEKTGISTLKIGYNSVFGYYIEVTHQHRERVPDRYTRKQTVRNAERYITSELKDHENEVLTAADRAKAREQDLFTALREQVTAQLGPLQQAADALANLDVLAGFAELARQRGYVVPELIESENELTLDIVEGRHPVLDRTLAERFVPNDCALAADDARLLILTGPNMAGKSTYIRQVALLTLLAQTGSFVPAQSMRLSPVDRIFARVGASDELARGHSTFMVEMVETARILHNATAQSLVILDEIGRGTSTYDGLSLAWAITEHVAKRIGCRTLFATHYHELTDLAERLPHVRNFNVAVSEALRPDGSGREIAFLHKIIPGVANRSYGVHVAEMAGLPKSVTRRSETILAQLEQRSAVAANPSDHDPDQMLLFGSDESAATAATMHPQMQSLLDELADVRIDETTPMEALQVLANLKKRIADQTDAV